MTERPEMSSDSDQKLSDLVAHMRDPNPVVWSKAADELCRMGTVAIPVMIEFLASDDENIRGYMAWALGKLGPPANTAIPGLLKLLTDQGASHFQEKQRAYPVRFRAAFAIAKIDPGRQEIIPLLREAMNYRKVDYIQAEAHETIRKLGSLAGVFLSELKAAENAPELIDRVRIPNDACGTRSDLRNHRRNGESGRENRPTNFIVVPDA